MDSNVNRVVTQPGKPGARAQVTRSQIRQAAPVQPPPTDEWVAAVWPDPSPLTPWWEEVLRGGRATPG